MRVITTLRGLQKVNVNHKMSHLVLTKMQDRSSKNLAVHLHIYTTSRLMLQYFEGQVFLSLPVSIAIFTVAYFGFSEESHICGMAD